jgi:beta-lactamase regulating signal transducer with metallopeptidase domain
LIKHKNKTINTIKVVLVFITLISALFLIYIIYQNQKFKTNTLPKEVWQKLEDKDNYIKELIKHKYNISVDIPIIISDKVKSNTFGLALHSRGQIAIVLNKKRFQESQEYMIDYVLPHEYAHALMFVFGKFTNENGGHTKLWQDICLSLEGKKCDRYVKHNDIVFDKIGSDFF